MNGPIMITIKGDFFQSSALPDPSEAPTPEEIAQHRLIFYENTTLHSAHLRIGENLPFIITRNMPASKQLVFIIYFKGGLSKSDSQHWRKTI